MYTYRRNLNDGKVMQIEMQFSPLFAAHMGFMNTIVAYGVFYPFKSENVFR